MISEESGREEKEKRRSKPISSVLLDLDRL